MAILLTGASGKLGTELLKHFEALTPSQAEMDVTDLESVQNYVKNKPIDLIVHCAAYADVVGAETNKDLCYRSNVIGTLNIAKLGLPTIHISSDGVFPGDQGYYLEDEYLEPTNYYNFSKCMAEMPIRMLERFVIVRMSFRMRPFPYEYACMDKFSSAEYIDVIGKYIADMVINFDKYPTGIYHIGTDRQSVYDLAVQTREVKPMSYKDIKVKLQKDSSLNLTKWRILWKE
jgi:dTDP-4-dehydrorhamnose reductase